MHRFRRTYEFVKTWAEVESKVKDVQLLLCEKLTTVSKKTFHSRTVDVSKRHNVVWHKGIPYICIGYRSYACIRGKKKKEEAKIKNEELAKMIESIRVNVKHVLIFPEFKVESKTDKFTRKSVARVLKEKLNTTDVITEERYMFSAQIPELEKLLKYSYLKHQVEYCNQHPYAEPLYKPNIGRRRARSYKAPEGEVKQSMKQNQEYFSKSFFPVAHLKGRWGRIHLVSNEQALPREITGKGLNLSKCVKYRSNPSPEKEAVDNEETVDATFYLIGEAVDGNSIEVSIIDDVEFKNRTFSDEIAFICEKKDHLAHPEIVVNRQEVSNLSDTELISTVSQISFLPERKEEEIETEIVEQSIDGSNVQFVSSENGISFESEEHEEVIPQLQSESTVSSENTTNKNVIVQNKENLSDFQVNLNDDLTMLNENGQCVGNFTDIEECSTAVSNEYNDTVITDETLACSIVGRISTKTIQACNNFSTEIFKNCNTVGEINKTCANEASQPSSDISVEECSVSVNHNDISKTIAPTSSVSEMANFSDQEINKFINGDSLVFNKNQLTVCDTVKDFKFIATDGKPALLNKDITHRSSEQLSCISNTKKLIVSNIIQDNANQSKLSRSSSKLVCRAQVSAASLKTGKNKQSDGIELLLTPISEVAAKSLLAPKNLKQINLSCTKGKMLLNHLQKSVSKTNFTQSVEEQTKLNCPEHELASVRSNSSITDLALSDNTEQASTCSDAEQLLVYQPGESIEMQVHNSDFENQNKLVESKSITTLVSSEWNTSSESNKVAPLKALRKVGVLQNRRKSFISPNEEIFVEVISNERVWQKDELKSISLGLQSPMTSAKPHKNVKRVSLLKKSAQSLPCSSQNSKNVDSNVAGSLSHIITEQLATSRNSTNSSITSNKQSSSLLPGEPLSTNNIQITNPLCGDILNQYTVRRDESGGRELLTVPVVRDSELILERVLIGNSVVQHNISPAKNLADSENFSTLAVINENESVNHKSNNSQLIYSSKSVADSKTLMQEKNYERECERNLQDSKNINHKRNFDVAEEALVSLALEMASEFDVLCKRRKRIFKEKTLSLLKSLLHEQNAATKAENIKLKHSDEKYFLHNGLLYKYV